MSEVTFTEPNSLGIKFQEDVQPGGKRGLCEIYWVERGSAAERLAVQVGWRVAKVGGVPMAGRDFEFVIAALKSPQRPLVVQFALQSGEQFGARVSPPRDRGPQLLNQAGGGRPSPVEHQQTGGQVTQVRELPTEALSVLEAARQAQQARIARLAPPPVLATTDVDDSSDDDAELPQLPPDSEPEPDYDDDSPQLAPPDFSPPPQTFATADDSPVGPPLNTEGSSPDDEVGFPPLFLRFSIGKCRNYPFFRAFFTKK